MGGSIGGGGVEIKQDGSGRLVYDSSQGTAYLGTLPLAKGVSQEVSDAVDQVRQVSGHTDFAPPVTRDIKGILSLDGFPVFCYGSKPLQLLETKS